MNDPQLPEPPITEPKTATDPSQPGSDPTQNQPTLPTEPLHPQERPQERPPDSTPQTEKAAQSNWDHPRITDWIMAWTTVGILVATGLNVYVANKQWEATEKAISMNEKALVQSTRAWITVPNAAFFRQSQTRPKRTVIIERKNSGNSPALKTISSHSVVFLKAVPTGPMPKQHVINEQSRAVLGPGTSMFMDQGPSNWEPRMNLVAYGAIEYEDIFHVVHRTTFCFQLPSIDPTVERQPLFACPNDWNHAD